MIGKAAKRHMVGFETELLILEENGAVSTRADDLINAANASGAEYPLRHDYTHNMVEIASVANIQVRKGAHTWLRTLEKVNKVAKGMGLRVYPHGTYPGLHVPTPRTDAYYRMCETVLGPERYVHSTGHVLGFHFHYCLPYGTFNRKTTGLKRLFRSKNRNTLLGLYNIIIAADPALSNLMESSPFVDGVHLGKDSRVLLYRAMRARAGETAVRGLYSEMPLFGMLPQYADSITELIMLTENRYEAWKELVGEKCPEYMGEVESRHPLQFNWGPLRINRVGTLEYRGLDMNLPSYMIGASLILKYLLKKVRADGLIVTPSDIGIKEPFRVEGERIYVPPHSYVRQVLQLKSALAGLADSEVYRYTRQMVSLALKSVPNKSDPGLSRVKGIIESRKSKSDEILEKVRKEGYGPSERLDEEFARSLALRLCDELQDEVSRMMSRELIIDLEN
ncbi:MAG: hypothetical protein WC588_01015 [Candidatus Micrarchaeia archaeon]